MKILDELKELWNKDDAPKKQLRPSLRKTLEDKKYLDDYDLKLDDEIDPHGGKLTTQHQQTPEEDGAKPYAPPLPTKSRKLLPTKLPKALGWSLFLSNFPLIKNYFRPKFYQVYLILPDDKGEHTSLVPFKHRFPDGTVETLFFLQYNQHVYRSDDIDGFATDDPNKGIDGNLDAGVCNFLYLKNSGALELWAGEFSEEAKRQIRLVEKMKLKDRMFEQTMYEITAKYGAKNPFDLLVSVIIISLAVGILFWFMFNGLPGVISAVNAGMSPQPVNVTANMINNTTQTYIPIATNTPIGRT